MWTADVKSTLNTMALAIFLYGFGSQWGDVVSLHLPIVLCGYNSTAHYIGPSMYLPDDDDRRMISYQVHENDKRTTPRQIKRGNQNDWDIIAGKLEEMARTYCKSYKGATLRLPENWFDDGSFNGISYETRKDSGKQHARKLCGILNYELFDDNSPGVSTEKIIQSFIYITYNATHVPRVIKNDEWTDLIGNPYHMWQAAILARNIISPDLMKAYLNRYWRNTLHGDVWNTTCRNDKNAGGNYGPRALSAIPEALLNNEISFDDFYDELKHRMIEEIVDRRAFMNDSFRFDGSIHQHNAIVPIHHQQGTGILILNQNYIANYGKELLMNVAIILYIMSGTSYEFEPNIRNATFDCFFEGEQWLYRGHIIDPSTTGRKLDQGDVVTKYGARDGALSTLTYLEKVPFRHDEVLSALHRYHNVPPAAEHALIGNKNFFLSDGMAHQRREFMATLKMMSLRCNRPETKPRRNENTYGYFLGDAFLTLVVDGNELGVTKAEVFQAYDWAKIPGVTCPYMIEVPKHHTDPNELLHMINDHHFVGGVSDGRFGLAAMVYARPTVTVRARKSFFFLDNAILAMGSGITQTNSTDDSSIITTLNQVMFSENYSGGAVGNISSSNAKGQTIWSEDLKTNFNIIHHQTVGYVSLESDGKLITEVVDKTIGSTPVSVFSAWIDHGSFVTGAKYSYAMLPSYSLSETLAFAINPSVSILSLTNSRHDACDLSTKVQGVVLFDVGCFQISNCLDLPTAEVCSNQPSMILAKIIPLTDIGKCSAQKEVKNTALVGSVIRLDVADPTHLLNKLNLELKMNGITYVNEVDLPDDPMLGDTTNACFVFTN